MKRFFYYILLASMAIACHIETPQRPLARFTFTPANGCTAPCKVTFTSDVENAESLLWDFGDNGPKESGDTVSHVFTTAKSYHVKLTVKGVDGGSSGYTRMVDIDNIEPVSLFGDTNFPTDILSDSDGNIYISGTGSGTIDFGNKHIHKLTAGSDDFFVAKYNNNGQCQWVYANGSSGPDHANALILDKNNDVYVTGFISGMAPGRVTPEMGDSDGFVIKLRGVDGTARWFQTFGGKLEDQGRSLAFYHDGDGAKIYLVGTVKGDNQKSDISFNPEKLEKANDRAGFLAILTAEEGTFKTVKIMDGPNVQVPETITVDDLGNAYIAGGFKESIQFPDLTEPLESAGEVDIFIAKWGNISRKFQWARRTGSPRDDFAYDIVVAPLSRNVFVTGMHSGDLPELSLKSGGDENVYLGKWSTNGDVLKANNGFTEEIKDYHGGIALTAKGNVVIAGSFTQTGSFPMSNRASVLSEGSTDIIVTEVDPDKLERVGDFLVRDGGVLEDRVNKICVTNSGHVYVTGWSYGSPTYKGKVLKGDNEVKNTFIVRYKL